MFILNSVLQRHVVHVEYGGKTIKRTMYTLQQKKKEFLKVY